MTITSITALMILAIIVGKSSKEFGMKQLIIIVLISLAQVIIAAFEMFTKAVPPWR